MHVFGLTGGIASGKSTVSARFRARGVPIVDADELAREVVAPGTEGLAAVVAAFGPGVLGADGALDRKALAALVFGDEAKRKQLNAIVHPRIGAASAAKLAALGAGGAALVCYDAALLVENGLGDAFRPLVVVAAPENVQIARIMKRDGATEDEARARIRAQRPLAEKVAVADVVIDNGGSLGELLAAADRALDDVAERVGLAHLEPAPK
jgi:dephospho-CoA kinase